MHNKLPKQYYFIDKFDKKILENQSTKTAIIYRNYSKTINKLEIIKLREFCNKKKLKLFLSNDFKLALKLNLNGAYIPSFKGEQVSRGICDSAYMKKINTASTRETTKTPLSLILEPERKIQPLSWDSRRPNSRLGLGEKPRIKP